MAIKCYLSTLCHLHIAEGHGKSQYGDMTKLGSEKNSRENQASQITATYHLTYLGKKKIQWNMAGKLQSRTVFLLQCSYLVTKTWKNKNN